MITGKSLASRIPIWRHTSTRTRRRRVAFYQFLTPWLIGFVFLSVIPLLLGFLTSLTNYDGLNLASVKFVGLRNYVWALTRDPQARFSLGRTLLWGALNLPAWVVLSFMLALILNQKVRGRGFFRTLYYLPYVVPVVATVWVWKIFLDRNYGLLNASISLFRPGTAIPWLSTYGILGLTAVAVWRGLGWGMVIFLAGLQDIPDELLEAARIDGANTWQVFRHVTIPLMTPVIFFVLVNGLISSFQQFVLPLLLSSAGSNKDAGVLISRSVYLYMIHTYQQLFGFQRFGYGIALLWLLIIIIVALTVLIFKTSRYWVYYAVEAEGEGQ